MEGLSTLVLSTLVSCRQSDNFGYLCVEEVEEGAGWGQG